VRHWAMARSTRRCGPVAHRSESPGTDSARVTRNVRRASGLVRKRRTDYPIPASARLWSVEGEGSGEVFCGDPSRNEEVRTAINDVERDSLTSNETKAR